MSRKFNGTTDKITLASSASLNSLLPKFTFMAWLFLTADDPAFGMIFDTESGGDYTTDSLRALILPAWTGTSRLVQFQVAASTTWASTISLAALPLNQWVHLAGIYDDSATPRCADLFVNGVLTSDPAARTAAVGTLSPAITGKPILLGASGVAGSLIGNMAEVQFYNAVLTPAQILSAMNGAVPLPANLVAFLDLDGTLSPEPDESPNGNVGILTGTTLGPALRLQTSIREQIMVQLMADLNAGAGGSASTLGLTVHRERTRPIEQDSLPSIMAYADDDVPKPLGQQVYGSPLTERQFSLALECRAKGSPSVSPDAALDPILVFAATAVLANERFGGLASGVEEGRTVWSSREGDVTVAAAKLSFTIKYRTSRLDPTSKS